MEKTNWHDHLLWMDPHRTAWQAATYKLNSFRHAGYPCRWKENIPFGSTLLLMINTEPTNIILRPKKSSTPYFFHDFVMLPPPATSLHLHQYVYIYIYIYIYIFIYLQTKVLGIHNCTIKDFIFLGSEVVSMSKCFLPFTGTWCLQCQECKAHERWAREDEGNMFPQVTGNHWPRNATSSRRRP